MYVHFMNVHTMYIAVRTYVYLKCMFNSHSFYVHVWPDIKWTLFVRSLYIQCRLGNVISSRLRHYMRILTGDVN